MQKQFFFFLISICVFFSNLTAQVTPVACYPFNSNALDVSGNNHHGIVAGAALTEDRFGNLNCAYLFDGVDDSILIADTLSQFITSNELTIVFWAKANALGSNSPFLLMPDNYNDRLNIHVHYLHSAGAGSFWDYGDASNSGRLIYYTPYNSQWDHYAFVVSQLNSFMGIYKNGNLLASKNSMSILIDKNKLLSIGGGISGVTNCHFNGVIDDVQIFGQPLNQLEILDNYNNGNNCINVGYFEIVEDKLNKINLTPNPAINYSILCKNNLKPSQEYNIRIFDLSGKQLTLTKVNSDANGHLEMQLNLTALSKGMYFVEIYTNWYSTYSKIIKI